MGHSSIPSGIRSAAVSGSFVDLQEFLPREFLIPGDTYTIKATHNPDTDTLTFHRSLPGNGIDNVIDWMRAWNNYERVLMSKNSSLYSELVSYRDFILQCSRKFKWQCVYIYDQKFRSLLAEHPSMRFSIINHDLYVNTLDKDAIRQDAVRCHRCKSFEHKVAYCPFPRSAPRKKRTHKKQTGLLNTHASSTQTMEVKIAEHSPSHAPTPEVAHAALLPHQSPLTPVSPDNSSTGCVTPSHPAPHHQSSLTSVSQDKLFTECINHTTSPDQSKLTPVSQDTSSTEYDTHPSPHLPPYTLTLVSQDNTSTRCITHPLPAVPGTTETLSTDSPGTNLSSQTLPPLAEEVITSPVHRLNADAFQRGLSSHEDRKFADYIVQACKQGVNIGYFGPRYYREFKNWPSTTKFYDHVKADIDKEIAAGTKVGPFLHPPFPNFVGSPLGAFERRRSKKVRTIHDLSWQPGASINDYIDKEDFKISYLSLNDVIAIILEYGQHAQLAKLDLEAAFHHIPVRPEDFELLGSTFHRYDPATGTYRKEYYYDRVLEFGGRSSPKLFSDFASAAKFIMESNGATNANHYLDDYITVGASGTSECADNLNTMISTCNDLGFSLNPSKISEPSTVMEYLGIVLDTDLLQARISADRLTEVLNELNQWRQRQTATKRQVLSLIGKLSFVSRVVRPGRTFIRRMLSIASKVQHLHQKVTLTDEFHLDVKWWLTYLPQWNGVSMFPRSHWEASADMHLFTDSSDLAAAGYYDSAWFVVPFIYEFSELKSMSINWRELFAIIVAAETFGSRWSGKRILMHCDNMCVVEVVNSGSSKSVDIMDLIRKLFFVCAKFHFEIRTCYINTKVNDIADALSRLQFDRFCQLAPQADVHMTMPVLMS